MLSLGSKKGIKSKGKDASFDESLSSKNDSFNNQMQDGNAEEEDPLDTFMKDVEVEVEQLNELDKKRAKQLSKGKTRLEKLESIANEEDDVEAEDIGSDPEDILA